MFACKFYLFCIPSVVFCTFDNFEHGRPRCVAWSASSLFKIAIEFEQEVV
jgi:hypothetical protein